MPLDAESRELIDAMQASSAPVETLTPQEARDASDARRAASPRTLEPVHSIGDRDIDTGAGALRIRIYRPSDAAGLPVIVFFHGGGWVLCDLESHDNICRAVANGTESVVVAVDYRRAPEHRYPAAVEDCYAATRWVADHADDLGVDATRLAVMGDSAGGNLAAAVALMARDRSGPPLALQVLIYPVIADDFDTASYRAYGADHFLTAAAMRWYWDQYVPARRRSEPYASPIRADSLRGIAPATVLVAECDPLHDEGVAYARRLAAEGVETSLIDFAGGFHGFLGLGDFVAVAREAMAEVNTLVRKQLSAVDPGAG